MKLKKFQNKIVTCSTNQQTGITYVEQSSNKLSERIPELFSDILINYISVWKMLLFCKAFTLVSRKFQNHDFILIKLISKRFFLPSKVIRRLQHISHQRRTGIYRKSMKVNLSQT
jgi:hypothetical protein